MYQNELLLSYSTAPQSALEVGSCWKLAWRAGRGAGEGSMVVVAGGEQGEAPVVRAYSIIVMYAAVGKQVGK